MTATTTAGGYSHKADQQKKQADTWRIVAIVLAAVAAVGSVSVGLLLLTSSGGFEAGEITTKVLFAVSFSALEDDEEATTAGELGRRRRAGSGVWRAKSRRAL